MENLKYKVWDVPLYEGKLIIVDTDNGGAFNKKFGAEVFEEDEYVYAHAVRGDYKNKRAYYIVINSKADYPITHGIISHEALHITFHILECIGFVLDYNNHEPVTYLTEWVTNKVYEFYKIDRIAVKSE